MQSFRVIKSTQEQAIASWIDNLNQLRLDELAAKLGAQDINLEGALRELLELKNFITNPQNILGNIHSKHGEIAEHLQVNVSNARWIIEGFSPEYTFEGVGRTAPEDYLFNGVKVQSKYLNGLINTLTTNKGVLGHLSKYPEFLNNGGIYQIPQDQYNTMHDLLSLSEEEIKKAPREVRALVKKLKDFQEQTGIDLSGNSIQPAIGNYKDVQLNTIDDTIENEEMSIHKKNQERRNDAFQRSKPTLQEGVKVTAASFAIEGGISFCLAVHRKIKSGKNLSDFTENDWKDIGIDSSIGSIKGGIRGGSIYALTNFTATPAAVASGLVTATFGVAGQAKLLQEGKISDEDFIINSEIICLDVTMSAISSLMGQVIIPVPVLGALIGNAAGMFMYGIAKNTLSKQEQTLIAKSNNAIQILNKHLDEQYLELISLLQQEFAKFKSILDLALDLDVNLAFAGSIAMAQYVGCDKDKIIWNKQDIDAYFLN